MRLRPLSSVDSDGSRRLSFMLGDEPITHTVIEQKLCRKIVNLARIKKDLEICVASLNAALELMIDMWNSGKQLNSVNAEYPEDSLTFQALICTAFVSYGRAFVDSAIDHRRIYSTDSGRRYADLHAWAMDSMRHGYFAHTRSHPFDVPVVAATFFPMRGLAYRGIVSNLNFHLHVDETAIQDMLEMAEYVYNDVCDRLMKRIDDLDDYLRKSGKLPELAQASVYVTEIPAPPKPPRLTPR